MEVFKASTQYGDWKGSISADKSDETTLAKLLLERGLRTADEILVGAKLYIGENRGNRLGRVSVSAYLFDGSKVDSVALAIAEAGDALQLKVVDVPLSLEEFVTLFKRVELTLSYPQLDLDGREYSAA